MPCIYAHNGLQRYHGLVCDDFDIQKIEPVKDGNCCGGGRFGRIKK